MDEKEVPAGERRFDRRRHKRIRVDLPGRLFIPSEEREERCTIVDLSPGGANVQCAHVPPPDAQVVLYVDGFGRFEGQVARREDDSFGVRFNCTALKRERIAEQLMLFLNKSLVDGSALRRHERSPTKGFTRFTRADGQLVRCEVLDLSTSGVSVKTAVKPPIGEYVLIGQMAGQIARHHETGVGIEFVGNVTERASEERVKTKLVVTR